jgi:hypothetical protein
VSHRSPADAKFVSLPAFPAVYPCYKGDFSHLGPCLVPLIEGLASLTEVSGFRTRSFGSEQRGVSTFLGGFRENRNPGFALESTKETEAVIVAGIPRRRRADLLRARAREQRCSSSRVDEREIPGGARSHLRKPGGSSSRLERGGGWAGRRAGVRVQAGHRRAGGRNSSAVAVRWRYRTLPYAATITSGGVPWSLRLCTPESGWSA